MLQLLTAVALCASKASGMTMSPTFVMTGSSELRTTLCVVIFASAAISTTTNELDELAPLHPPSRIMNQMHRHPITTRVATIGAVHAPVRIAAVAAAAAEASTRAAVEGSERSTESVPERFVFTAVARRMFCPLVPANAVCVFPLVSSCSPAVAPPALASAVTVTLLGIAAVFKYNHNKVRRESSQKCAKSK